MADKGFLNNDELALFFHFMRPISAPKAQEALTAVRRHIDAQADRIVHLERLVEEAKSRETDWRARAKQILCPSDLSALGILSAGVKEWLR